MVRLRLVNAALPRADSQSELRRCRETAARLGLLDCVDWFTEFLEEDAAVDLLSQADLIVLPYMHTPESASGALRIALASGAPVAASGATIFDGFVNENMNKEYGFTSIYVLNVF